MRPTKKIRRLRLGRFPRNWTGAMLLIASLPALLLGLALTGNDWNETLGSWHDRLFGMPLTDEWTDQ